MTDRELMQMVLDALIDAADSQSWEMQQNIDQHGEWYRRSVYLKEAVTKSQKAIEALRAALAQPEPEEDYDAIANKQLASLKAAAKVTFEDAVVRAVHKLYTAPPQREWQGLTDDEIREFEIWLDNDEEEHGWNPPENIVKYLEAKLKEKNA